MNRFVLPILGLVLICVQAPAQTTTVRTLGHDDAVKLARANNPDIKQLQRDLEIARTDLGAATADLYMPSVSLSGTFTLIDPDTVEKTRLTSSPQYLDNYSATLSISKLLFSGTKFLIAVDLKKAAVEIAERKLSDKVQEITRLTRTGFFSLLLVRENVKIVEDADRSLLERLEYTRVNYANGLSSYLDFVRAQAQYKNNQPRVLKARNAFQTAKATFCNLIGVPDPETAEFSGNLTDSLTLAMTEKAESVLVDRACAADLRLKVIDYNIRVVELTRASAGAGRWPSINGTFGFKYDYKRDVGATDRSLVPGYSLVFSVSIPLDSYIPGVTRLAFLEKGYEEQAAKYRIAREQTVEAIRLQVKTLLLQIQEAEQTIESQLETVKLAFLAYDIAIRQYREGNLSSLDLADNEATYNQALVYYYQAMYDRYASILLLNDIID